VSHGDEHRPFHPLHRGGWACTGAGSSGPSGGARCTGKRHRISSGVHALGIPDGRSILAPGSTLTPGLPTAHAAVTHEGGSLPGDSGGTAPDSHRTSFTAIAGEPTTPPPPGQSSVGGLPAVRAVERVRLEKATVAVGRSILVIIWHLLSDPGQGCRKASRSALIVSASVVGMPCGNPWYVFSVPCLRSRADSGPESA
jgi:hypothetical protein